MNYHEILLRHNHNKHLQGSVSTVYYSYLREEELIQANQSILLGCQK